MPARTAGPGDPAKDRTDGVAPSGLPRRRRDRRPFEPAAGASQQEREDTGQGESPADLFDLFTAPPPRGPARSASEPAAGAPGHTWAGQASGGRPVTDPDVVQTGPLPALSPYGGRRWRLPSAFSPQWGSQLREGLRTVSLGSRLKVVAWVGAVAVAVGAVVVASIGPGGRSGTSGHRALAGSGAGGVALPSASSGGGPDGVSSPTAVTGRASPSPAHGGRVSVARPGAPAQPGAQPGRAAQSAGPSPSPAKATPRPAAGSPSPSAHASPSAQASATVVSGDVTCTSGAAVVGVWVAATAGSGWASLAAGSGSAMAYDFTLPESESYSIHVGCGGTSASWKIAVYSPYVTGTANSFACHDVPGGTDYKTCDLV